MPRKRAAPDPSIAALRSRLLSWYARSHRDLPWRRTTDAYRVWVSEIMLQQTRVESVIPYYERFIDRYENTRALAAAPLDDVLAVWSGLGYYRRARNLHAAAAQVVREHAGDFPRELGKAIDLPGIGRSTAGAIVSIAYGVRAPVLDGNVKRVLTRLFALRGDPDANPLEARLWELAGRLVDVGDSDGDPGSVNQVMMELGATVCLPFAAARCDECPVDGLCKARAEGESKVARLPEKRGKSRLVPQTWLVAVVARNGQRLVHQRAGGGLLHGMWEFPTFETPADMAEDAAAARARLAGDLRARFGAQFRVGDELLVHRQVISNRKVTQRVFSAATGGRTNARACWLEDEQIRALGITTATRRILARLGADVSRPAGSVPPPSRPRTRVR